MKVLHVISDENIGGAGVLLTSLLRHFDPLRVQSVVALPRGSALAERIAALNVPVCELEHPCDRISYASVRELSHLICAMGVDIVHANAALSARLAGRRCGKGVLHTRHCCYPPRGAWRFWGVRMLGGIWNRALSDRVIATADAAARDLTLLGIPQGRIDVILNGSDPVREVSKDELDAARRRYGIAEDSFVVGICARLEPCKSHETFLQAAKLLIERYPLHRFSFLIVGAGTRRAELEVMCEMLGLESNVRFTGFVSDMAPIYRLLRVNVNCSVGTETSCLAVSEGMSAGVPAIVSDYGGNSAMIGESAAGVVYPIGDAVALADAIGKIVLDPVLELHMRRAAREQFESCYTAGAMTESVTRVYEQMTEKRSAHNMRRVKAGDMHL